MKVELFLKNNNTRRVHSPPHPALPFRLARGSRRGGHGLSRLVVLRTTTRVPHPSLSFFSPHPKRQHRDSAPILATASPFG